MLLLLLLFAFGLHFIEKSVTTFRLKKSKRIYTQNRVQCTQGKLDSALWFPVYRVVGHMRFRDQKKKKKEMVITEEVVIIWNDNKKTPAVVNVKDLNCRQLMQEYRDRIKTHGGSFEMDDEGTDSTIGNSHF